MSPEQQRYEVTQIIAEGRERGYPLLMTVTAVALWFQKHGIPAPVNLLDWLGEGDGLWHRTAGKSVH